MKKFVAAEIAELNVNETASGIWKSHVEVWPIHDKGTHNPCHPTNPNPGEEDKSEEETNNPENQNS